MKNKNDLIKRLNEIKERLKVVEEMLKISREANEVNEIDLKNYNKFKYEQGDELIIYELVQDIERINNNIQLLELEKKILKDEKKSIIKTLYSSEPNQPGN